MRDDQLERISDDIRHGIPVGIAEALAAIDYQERLRVEKASRPTLWKRFKAWAFGQNTKEQPT